MTRTYMVICGATQEMVEELAKDREFTVLKPIRDFTGVTSEDDGSFGLDFGRINTADGKGWVALCYQDIDD